MNRRPQILKLSEEEDAKQSPDQRRVRSTLEIEAERARRRLDSLNSSIAQSESPQREFEAKRAK